MSLPKQVSICEVCPRDGWQNHPVPIPSEVKIKHIKKMVACGARKLEVTSFVNPKYVPQMGDAKEVYAGLKDFFAANGVSASALALNRRGVDDARASGFQTVNFVLSASEEHNLRNSRRTIQESLTAFKELARHAEGLHIILAMPCVFGSPFGDEVPIDRVKRLMDEALSVGVTEFGVADTAGISDPENTRRVLRALIAHVGVDKLSLHMHDTYGMGLANIYVALEEGVTMLDAALGGMGGCPFVPGAKGNIATEDLVNMCEKMGVKTGYQLPALVSAAKEMCADIQAQVGGSVSLACHE